MFCLVTVFVCVVGGNLPREDTTAVQSNDPGKAKETNPDTDEKWRDEEWEVGVARMWLEKNLIMRALSQFSRQYELSTIRIS